MSDLQGLLSQFRGNPESPGNSENNGSPFRQYAAIEGPLNSNAPARAVFGSPPRYNEDGQQPSSPKRPSTAEGGGRSTSPRPSSSVGIRGYIATPGELYATPPAVILRSYGGFAEGQLQYQYGKVAPLMPSYAPSWLKEPPQRAHVTDLRLQPSSRAITCYSPEFLAEAASSPPPGASAPAPALPSRPCTAVPVMPPPPPRFPRPATAPSWGGAGSRYSSPGRSVPGSPQRRLDPSASNLSAIAAAAAAAVRGVPSGPFPRPTRSASARWGAHGLASFHAYNRTGWGGGRSGTAAVGPMVGTRAGGPHAEGPRVHAPTTSHTYFRGIKKGLARSPLTEYVRATAKSSFQMPDQGVAPTASALAKRAAAALSLSRTQSRVAHETVALPKSPPRRTTHEPQVGERDERVVAAASHDASPRLKYRERVSLWGVI